MGCVTAEPAAAGEKIAQIRAYEQQIEERTPRYAVRSTMEAEDGRVSLLLPRLRVQCSGLFRDGDAGLTVGYVGRFDDGPLAGVADGEPLAEAIAARYRQHGVDLARPLGGSFQIFVDDRRARRRLLINDHYGSYQSFYARVGPVFCFAPEVPMLVEGCGLETHIGLGPVTTYLLLGQMLHGSTFIDEVNGLPPGTTVEISPEVGVRFHRHYEYRFEDPEPGRGDAPLDERAVSGYVEGLTRELAGALARRAHLFEHSIIPLSGGYDSRGLAAFACEAAKESGARVRTLTWGVPDGEKVPGSDPEVARRVSEYLGTEHTYAVRDTTHWERDFEDMFDVLDGLTDDCAMHSNEYDIMRRIHGEHGADHIYLGNHLFGPAGPAGSDVEAMGRIGIVTLDRYEQLWPLFVPDRVDELCESSRAYAHRVLDDCPMRDFNNRKDYLHYTQRLQNYTNRSGHYKQCAVWTHNPWLDRSVIDYMRAVPPQLRINKKLFKRALDQRFPALAEIKTAPFLGDGVEDWQSIVRRRQDIRSVLVKELLTEQNGLHELLDPRGLRTYIDDFLSGRPLHRAWWIPAVQRAKKVLARSPRIYGVLKRATMEHVPLQDEDPTVVLFRLLILKRIYGRYGR